MDQLLQFNLNAKPVDKRKDLQLPTRENSTTTIENVIKLKRSLNICVVITKPGLRFLIVLGRKIDI